MAMHDSQWPHGSPSPGSVQLRALARMRAIEVLPVPRGPGEEVGVADPAVAHGVAQGGDDVVLADDLAEAAWPVAPVERLVGHAPIGTGRVDATGAVPIRVGQRAGPSEVTARRSEAPRELR